MNALAESFVIVCFVIFFVYFIVAAFSAKRTIKRSGGGRFLTFAVIAAFVLLKMGKVSPALSAYSDVVVFPQSSAVFIIADVVTLAGLLIALWARAVLGGNWSAGVALKEDHELIERGPYAYVRHPLYSGVLLMLLGAVASFGRVDGFVLFVILSGGLWFRALQKEKLLVKHFPETYPEYQKRTKALIPFVV